MTLLPMAKPWREVHLPVGLPNIVLDYLGGHLDFNWPGNDDSKPFFHEDRQKFTLFGHKSDALINQLATTASTLILSGEEEKIEIALAIIQENPHLINYSVIVSDPLKRRVSGTPLQIAAMAGDVDLRSGITEERDRGVVEQLIAVANLSSEEVATQLAVVTSKEAIKANAVRNQRILEAVIRFGKGIILKRNKNTSEAFQAECQPLINQLEKDLTPDANTVTTSGYIFDFAIVCDALKWFEGNVKSYQRGYTQSTDVLWNYGYGKLQSKLSARDAQVMLSGIDRVVNDNVIPDRTLKNKNGSSYFYNSHSRLGGDFHLDYYFPGWGDRVGNGCGAGLGAPAEKSTGAALHEILCRTKTAALENLCNTSALRARA